MPKRKIDAVSLEAKKLKMVVKLGELFAGAGFNIKSPLMKLTVRQFVRILDTVSLEEAVEDSEDASGSRDNESRSEKSGSDDSASSSMEDDYSGGDDESEGEPAKFLVGYRSLVNLTASCKAMSLFMLKKQYRDGFALLAEHRGHINGIRQPGFSYLDTYTTEVVNAAIASKSPDAEKVTNHLWSPLEFLLNSVGFPACRHCGMTCGDLRGKNGLPISPYLVLRGKLKTPGDPLLKQDDPRHRKNRAILKAYRRNTYRCVNPSCGKDLDLMVVNTPLGSVFDGCLTTNKGKNKHHIFKKLKFQIYKPGSTKELDFQVKFCQRCGVLTTSKENLVKEVKCTGKCEEVKRARGLERKGPCLCDSKCKQCERTVRRCHCTICEKCKLCTGEECDRCEALCECSGDYCEDCGCDIDKCEC